MKPASTAVLLLVAGIAILSPQCLAADQDNVAASGGVDAGIPVTADAAGAAAETAESKEWSFETLKEDALNFARNALCGPVTDGQTEYVPQYLVCYVL